MMQYLDDLMWFPFCSENWVADVAGLTSNQSDIYSALLSECHCWHGLPDDDLYLAGVCRMSIDEWAEYRPVMEKFFILDTDPGNHPILDERLQDLSILCLIDTLGKDGLALPGEAVH